MSVQTVNAKCGINEAIFEYKGAIQREIINLNEEQIKIIKLFGHGCEKYYV